MAVIAAVIVIAGVVTALCLRNADNNDIGSKFDVKAPSAKDLGGGDMTCTMVIRCGTVIENIDSLEKEKVPYVPEDGVIFAKTEVSFNEGDTAFDVLEKVCEAADIQLEYNWTPLYDSYYIEGINHIYEFDCGADSGWMYKVNGDFPNYGCSSYTLKDGDEIEWHFSCVGLGEDIGARNMNK